ncbi:putative 4-amino-4-deoxychorismate protein [Nemania sp. FL0916]|nr:putative 4-amino-4-deoxychorismate protein [Nemania sp. FL0916]
MDKLNLFTTIRCDPSLLNLPSQGFTNLGWNQAPSPFYMLDFHRDRVLKAAIHWKWDAAVKALEGEAGLKALETLLRKNIIEAADADTDLPCRAKVLVDREGKLSVIRGPAEAADPRNLFPSFLPAPLSSHTTTTTTQDPPRNAGSKVPERNFEFEVVVDEQATAKSAYTHFKTTHRPMYDGARRRANITLGDKREVLLINQDDGSIMEGSITTPHFWRHGRWVTPPIPKEFSTTQGSGGNSGTTRRWALERGLVEEETVHVDSLVDGEECWVSNALIGFVHAKVKLQ